MAAVMKVPFVFLMIRGWIYDDTLQFEKLPFAQRTNIWFAEKSPPINIAAIIIRRLYDKYCSIVKRIVRFNNFHFQVKRTRLNYSFQESRTIFIRYLLSRNLFYSLKISAALHF